MKVVCIAGSFRSGTGMRRSRNPKYATTGDIATAIASIAARTLTRRIANAGRGPAEVARAGHAARRYDTGPDGGSMITAILVTGQ